MLQGEDTSSNRTIFGGSFTGGTQSLVLQTGPAAVPEPGTLALTGLGMLGMAAWLRRRRKSSGQAATAGPHEGRGREFAPCLFLMRRTLQQASGARLKRRREAPPMQVGLEPLIFAADDGSAVGVPVRGLAVLVGLLAVLVGPRRVGFGFLMVAAAMMMRGLVMVVSRRVMVAGRLVMMLLGGMSRCQRGTSLRSEGFFALQRGSRRHGERRPATADFGSAAGILSVTLRRAS
jgi:hypothetical protein